MQPIANSIPFLTGTCNTNNSTSGLCCSAYPFLGKERKLPLFPVQTFRLPVKERGRSHHPLPCRTDFHQFTEVRQHRADLMWLMLTWSILKLRTKGRNPPDISRHHQQSPQSSSTLAWSELDPTEWVCGTGSMDSGPLLPFAQGKMDYDVIPDERAHTYTYCWAYSLSFKTRKSTSSCSLKTE